MTNSNDFLKELAKEFGLEYVQLSRHAAFLYYPNFYDICLANNFGVGKNKISIQRLDKVNICFDYSAVLMEGGYEEYNIWASEAIKQRLAISVNQAKNVSESIKKKKIMDKIKDLNKDFEN